MRENFALALQGIWNHKLRSFLTILGIIIGIASIITIVSTIKGTNEQIKESLIGSGINAVKVQLYQNDYPMDVQYSQLPEGVTPISEETRQALAEIDHVAGVSLIHSMDWVEGVYYRNVSFSGALLGVDESYFDVCGYTLHYGRGFLPEDYTDFRPVAILDEKASETLFGGHYPIGESVEIRAQPFVVVGVVGREATATLEINTVSDYYMYADTSSGTIFIPDGNWGKVFRFDEPQTAMLRADSTDYMTSVGKSAADIITEAHVSAQAQENALEYRSEDLMKQAEQLQALSNSTNMQLLWIAGISLLVGGIGVMNIMLVTVTERTQEIGLKKAIGARRRRILWQFLTEAAVLTSLGGILGVIAGVALAKVLSGVMGTPTAISAPAIVAAVGFSMVIGIVFGLLPAVKAARLDPIVALRRE